MHMAFAPDSFPRAPEGGCFVAQAAVGELGRERVRQELASEKDALPRCRSGGRRTGCARLARGCPIRASVGGVGGRRFLAMTPEPASWDPWEMVN